MTEPFVSVHMITYNHASYIAQAIECVLAQKTTFPFELVIGEDSSTDGTREIVFGYAQKYPDIIRIITSEQNVGMHKNSYRTTKACRGKYVAYCEGDDYWHRKDKLQLQVDYLESHTECGLVHSDQNRYFEESNILVKSFFQTMGYVPRDEINMFKGWNGYHILTCTAMARRILVDRIIEEESFYSGKDYIGGTDIPLFIELSMISKIHYINKSLATYTVRRESACHFLDITKQTAFTRSVCACYFYLAKKYNVESEIKRLKEQYISITLSCALWNKDIKMAKEIKGMYDLNIKQYIMYIAINNLLISYVMRLCLNFKYKIKNKFVVKMLMRNKK